MSQHKILKSIITRSVYCCDRVKIVMTKTVMFKCTYVATMRNIVATETFLAKSFSSQLGREREKNCRDVEKTRISSNQTILR